MCIGGLFATASKGPDAAWGREARTSAGRETFDTAYERQYALIQYGLSNGLYARDDAMTFLAALDSIRRREAAGRARGGRLGTREAADIRLRLETLQAQMRRSRPLG